VQTGSIVHVSNLHFPADVVTLDLFKIMFDDDASEPGVVSELSFEMMYYNDEILAVLVQSGRYDSWIYCIKTTPGLHNDDRLLRIVVVGPDNSKLFVRHTSQYLYYGSHTGISPNDGHHKWKIWGVALRPTLNMPAQQEQPLLLEDFHGSDIGSTVAFEIHAGFFYAVSNQGTYEVEEIDWTSFYNCIRFPLHDPVYKALQTDARVYRRQHAEGAIHDSWTDLTLQHDEETNDFFVVESRREWLGSSSKQARTFYTTRMSFSPPNSLDNPDSPDASSSAPPQLPANDILTTLLDSSSRANYMPTPRQYSWTRHPELGSSDIAQRSFILARTKFRAYNYSCSTFMDLVEDDKCCPDRSLSSPACLRLRIGSRRVAPPTLPSATGTNDKANLQQANQPTDGDFVDQTHYRYTSIRMWPPPASTCPCAAHLHRILNPTLTSPCGANILQRNITAISDARSIVYMIAPSNPYAYSTPSHSQSNTALGTIVLVDFGRSAPTSPTPATHELRWDWMPGQQKRCRSGTCM
jgi:hypothetical protein